MKLSEALSLGITGIAPLFSSEEMLYGKLTSKFFLFFCLTLLAGNTFCPIQVL
jgi:hypothetical protein